MGHVSRTSIFGILLAVALLPATRVIGMEFRTSIISDEMAVILGVGAIQSGDDERLRQAIRTLPGREGVLALDSEGGLVLPALDMADVVARFRIPVVVGQNAMCASACFLIFAASPNRIADETARIGVHSASLHAQENAATMALTTALARDAATYGVAHAIVGRLVTTPPNEMAWLTHAELRTMRVAVAPPGEERVQRTAPPRAAATVAPPHAAPPMPPAQAAIVRPPMVPDEQTRGQPQAFVDGLTDRTAWEVWISSLPPTARAGAEFWASQRSLPRPAPCPSSDAIFEAACVSARQRLTPTDVRRRSDPEYRRGWNAYVSTPPNFGLPQQPPAPQPAPAGVSVSPTAALFSADAVVRPVAAMRQRLSSGGMVGLRVSWQECEQAVARNGSPRSAEYCLVMIYSAYLFDQGFMASMGRAGQSTPGWEWSAVYPALVRMFDVMRVPVPDRRAQFTAYERWIIRALAAP